MKRLATLALAAVLVLPGCAMLCGGLDAESAGQNEKNVEQIVAENAAYLAADPKPDSLKAVQRDRNQAALELARALKASAR